MNIIIILVLVTVLLCMFYFSCNTHESFEEDLINEIADNLDINKPDIVCDDDDNILDLSKYKSKPGKQDSNIDDFMREINEINKMESSYHKKSNLFIPSSKMCPSGMKTIDNQDCGDLKQQAIIKPIINNGKIIGIDIINNGNAYKNKDLNITIETKSGTGFKGYMKCCSGKILGYKIINEGMNYNLDDTKLSVDPPKDTCKLCMLDSINN